MKMTASLFFPFVLFLSFCDEGLGGEGAFFGVRTIVYAMFCTM